MIGLFNADSSFFNITIDDVPGVYKNKLGQELFNDDVISLTINEEVGKATSGSLSLYDPEAKYASLLRLGMQMSISWGYKALDTNIRSIIALKKNPTEMQGSFEREGMTAYIMSPSGQGTQNGLITFNCNFYGTEWSKASERKVYAVGRSKYDIVFEVMTKLGIVTKDILFTKASELLTLNTQLVQWESDFKFLARMARDWRCIFRVGYTPAGIKHGIFCDHDKFDVTQFNKVVTGAAIGNSIQLDYKWGLANVISYKWQNHAGESGTGDHVRIMYVGGKPTFIRQIAEGETVTAYRFNPKKVTEELKRKGNKGGISAQTEYLKWAVNDIDYNSMLTLVDRGYFTKVEESTAPQGLGYSVNVEMLGNPLITPPIIVKFGEGFPDNLATKQVKMFFRKVSHNISKDGYKISGEIVDTLTYTGGSFVI